MSTTPAPERETVTLCDGRQLFERPGNQNPTLRLWAKYPDSDKPMRFPQGACDEQAIFETLRTHELQAALTAGVIEDVIARLGSHSHSRISDAIYMLRNVVPAKSAETDSGAADGPPVA